jgi:outer membrane protein assembly factor BamB
VKKFGKVIEWTALNRIDMNGMAKLLSFIGILSLAALPLTGCSDNQPTVAVPDAKPLAETSAIKSCCMPPVADLMVNAFPGAAIEAQGPPGALPQATFGGSIYRNLVNVVDKNVPTDWEVEEGKFKNIKWVAKVGTLTYGGPVVLGGRVFVGTNNDDPRDPKIKGRKAVLMCFAEKDGKFLWQNVHNEPPPNVIREADTYGLCSTPTVEGDFVYYCTPGCEVICAGVQNGKIQWRYDMMKELSVFPSYLCLCSPLIVGDIIYLCTANGTDEMRKVHSPDAPSFVALSKKDGRLIWKSNLPGANIIEGQWSNPVFADAGGRPQVIFAAGDGWVYGLQPKTGELIWKFQASLHADKRQVGITPAYFLGTPVVLGDRLFVGLGVAPDLGTPPKGGHFFCLDITKSGDVSCKAGNFDTKDPRNKDSALVWHFGGLVNPPPALAKGRSVYFGSTLSTAAVHDGLVYISELDGYLHCLDAKTGQRYWEHDCKAGVWASPYWVNGKIYLCTQDGMCLIFPHQKTYAKPREVDMQEVLDTTPVVGNGVLYIATKKRVYAIAAAK